MKIDILGTKYEMKRVDYGKDGFMEKMRFGGYCDAGTKQIVILNLRSCEEWENDSDDVIRHKENETIRHEIIHAFLNESGLQWNSKETDHWAKNEEMVDWFAIQMPKIIKAFEAAGAIL